MDKVLSTFLLSLSVIMTFPVHAMDMDNDIASYKNHFNLTSSTRLPDLSNSVVTQELVKLVNKRIPFVAQLVDNLEASVVNLAPLQKTKSTDWTQGDFMVELNKIKHNLCKSQVEVLTHIQKIALLTKSIKTLMRGEELPTSNRYRGETIDSLANKLKFVKADFVNDVGYSIQTTIPLLKAIFDQLVRQTNPTLLTTRQLWVDHFNTSYRIAQDYCKFITKGEKTVDEILALPEMKAMLPSPSQSPTVRSPVVAKKKLSPAEVKRLKDIGQGQIFDRDAIRHYIGIQPNDHPQVSNVRSKIQFFNGLAMQNENTSSSYADWRTSRRK